MTKLCGESGKLPKTSDHQPKFVDPQKFDFFIPSYPLTKCTFSSLIPPHLWQRAMYPPAGTLGAPIGAPKQQYLPPKRAHCPWPLFKRVRTSNTLLKLPNAPFLPSPHLTHGKGPCIRHMGPWGPPLEPPNNNIYPQNEPVVLSCFSRG